jgi:hypothetical protein
LGLLLGTNYGKSNNYELELAKENYTLVADLRIALQQDVLDFYINDYYEGNNTRTVDYNFHDTMFSAIYCDKNTILLLGAEFPPLPIMIGR